jgi:GcrA cell cycle regulator
MPRPSAARRLTGSTLPPLSTAPSLPEVAPPLCSAPATEMAIAAVPDPVVRDSVVVEPVPVRPPPTVSPAVRAVPTPVRAAPPRRARTMSCCWPLGEPGTPSFRFCDADAAPGKPYCGDHAAVAYVKVRDRREEAA